MRIIATPPSFN